MDKTGKSEGNIEEEKLRKKIKNGCERNWRLSKSDEVMEEKMARQVEEERWMERE